mmetsp:Transcript_20858/g.20209  ORF Transcript_20858/g.20209 Transcript_20858/m.20209 type:complete len:85 (+) Transcript_20858:208-462(+)
MLVFSHHYLYCCHWLHGCSCYHHPHHSLSGWRGRAGYHPMMGTRIQEMDAIEEIGGRGGGRGDRDSASEGRGEGRGCLLKLRER